MITFQKKTFLLIISIFLAINQPLQANESTSYWPDMFKDGKTFLMYCIVPCVFVSLCYRIYGSFKKKYDPSGKEPLKEPHVPSLNLNDYIGIPERVEDLVGQVKKCATNTTFGMPKDLLFFGETGVGKCFLAKAIAGELQAPLFTVDIGLFIGLSGISCWEKIESVFQEAEGAIKNNHEKGIKKRSIAIVFIDNIDLLPAGCVNKLVEKIESKNSKSETLHIIVIAATNEFKKVSEALVRAGRFENCINIDFPTHKDRQAKIQQLFKKFFTQHYFLHGNVSEGHWAKNWEQEVSNSSSSEDIPSVELVENNIQDTLSCRLARATTGMSFIEIEQLVCKVSDNHNKPRPKAFVKELWDRFYVNDYQKSLVSKSQRQKAHNNLFMLPISYDDFSDRVDQMSLRMLNELVSSVEKKHRDFLLKKSNDISEEEDNITSFFHEKCKNINQKINNVLVQKAKSLCTTIFPKKLVLDSSFSDPYEVMSLYGIHLQALVDYR